MLLIKIISGGQTGADIGGVRSAKDRGRAVGGTMPLGYRTLSGPRPEYAELYGMKECPSRNYAVRTAINVLDSDGTIRFANNFGSAGEKCTVRSIRRHRKPHFDVWVKDTERLWVPQEADPDRIIEWIKKFNIVTLNIAGNSESTFPGIEEWVYQFVGILIRRFDGLVEHS